MIRFCDNEVYCVLETEFNENNIEDCYSNDKGSIVIIDADGRFKGLISSGAIRYEKVVFDADVFTQCREYFTKNKKVAGEIELLPIVDKNGYLISFAYEEEDANRQLRMLKELEECGYALQFPDLYPQYEKVKIIGFNELAYCFAKYLQHQGVGVEVCGDMWELLESWECESTLDYRCLTIYAEGIDAVSSDLYERILHSVSVEFECIDKIYEKNILRKNFKNASGDIDVLLERLKQSEAVVILGSDVAAQNVYDWCMGNGIEVDCFVAEHKTPQTLFGKEIITEMEIISRYSNPMFIECHEKYSAWSTLSDYYSYLGYDRNEQFVCIRDYIELPSSRLLNVLKNSTVKVCGDVRLCKYLCRNLSEDGVGNVEYMDIEKISSEEAEDSLFLVVAPQIFNFMTAEEKYLSRQYIQLLEEKGIYNYTDYFSFIETFVQVSCEEKKYTIKELTPRGILLGSNQACGGDSFIKKLLDNHPDLLAMTEEGWLNNDLYWLCMRMSQESSEDILDTFWEIHASEGVPEIIRDPEIFNETMRKYLVLKERFTSQELFVMIHIAYASMWDENIENIGERYICWYPHFVYNEDIDGGFTLWLQEESIQSFILRQFRNCIMKLGSRVKLGAASIGKKNRTFLNVLETVSGENDIPGWNWVFTRFEDVKQFPERELGELCNILGISWSDTLLETTNHGNESACYNKETLIRGFDMGPVYNQYEKYFSEFDRFRVVLLNTDFQKRHGYTYENINRFTWRELQTMFEQPFRFEENIEFEDANDWFEYMWSRWKYFRERLYELKRIDIEGVV